MRLHALENACVNGVVDRGSGKAADLEQVSALGLELRHLLDLLLTHVFEVDDDTVRTRLGHDAIEGDDDNARIASLLNRAIQRVWRGGVDDDSVIALQDEVLDLRRLRRHFLVGGGENVRRRDDPVRHRLLGDDVVALQHRLPPRVSGVVVRKCDLHLAGVGVRRRGQKAGRRDQCEHRYVAKHGMSSLGDEHDAARRSKFLRFFLMKRQRSELPTLSTRANMLEKRRSIACSTPSPSPDRRGW